MIMNSNSICHMLSFLVVSLPFSQIDKDKPPLQMLLFMTALNDPMNIRKRQADTEREVLGRCGEAGRKAEVGLTHVDCFH